ncbi:hypothetical protein [Bacillus sp. 03113]|uniref:hypothetical protein n=1 Tax=Bacillus sp. 03113 TaxID=2578211 RepID=UPI001141BA68|nr:hypothetical protein [Bacillus sp. 03113]
MKKYHEIISEQINKLNISLTDIVAQCEKEGQKITVSYLSKLKNDRMPPPSYEVTRTLAKVLNIDSDTLVIISYLEQAPSEFQKILKLIRVITKIL